MAKLRTFKEDTITQIRTLNIETGKISTTSIKVEKGENGIFNIRQNEKGMLLSMPVNKIFNKPTDLFKPNSSKFKSIKNER